MPTHPRPMLLVAALFLAAAVCFAGEPGQAQPYERVRYPTFENGKLKTLLEADRADVYDLTSGTPSIALENVVIHIYDHAEMDSLPEDRPPPLKNKITSDRGFLTRQAPEPGAAIEEVANLEGNVILQQMREPSVDDVGLAPENPVSDTGSRLHPGVETEIRCEHAQWNATRRTLKGDGEVEFLQESSKINGTGFLYIADDDVAENSGKSNIKDWGGIVFIEHNARMEIDSAGGVRNFGEAGENASESNLTVITCEDTASYKMREREIQFEKNVRVRRQGLSIESDILKVFLRHEDDPLPENPCADGSSPLPGQVKNIVATIGRRPGSVVITGYTVNPVTGGETLQYVAKGGRADFDYDNNRITLTDTREQRWPEVEIGADGSDRITDRNLIFTFRSSCSGEGKGGEAELDSLIAFGGRGEVVLRTRRANPNDGPSTVTRVNYRGEMNYSRDEERIRFTDRVVLVRDDITISSELLDIRLTGSEAGMELSQLRRILAETNVDIQTGDYTAKAERAEYDVFSGVIGPPGSGLDTLRLFGPPGATPPHPWIREKEGNQITAPEIHMQRLTAGPGLRDQHLMVARGGISVCDFVTEPATESQKAKIVSIRCEQGMEYNQVNKKARFEGEVTAASDAPEDNYVLNSDRLLIDFEESPDPTRPGEYTTWIRRITAEGNARLMQDARLCEAANIIRDFPSSDTGAGDIYLQGLPASGERRARPAAYREQNGDQVGSQFIAPLIKSTAKGDLIQANGPGELSMPDDDGGDRRARIQFAGAASFESFGDGQASEARFWGGVKLNQPSRGIEIISDELDARFVQDDIPATFTGTATGTVDIARIGRLRRAEGRKEVRILSAARDGSRQTAEGDIGVVEFTSTGNIIRLSAEAAEPRRFVRASNSNGLLIISPELEVREAQGITRAAGPGDLRIPPDTSSGEGSPPTRVIYGENGSMVYNELALNIRVTNQVRIVQPGPGSNWSQPSMFGTCDRLDITLAEPPAENMSGTDALSRVARMDAIGSVVLQVYADPPLENPTMEWYARPGTTFFTRGDQAVYDVPRGEISIFCYENRQPQLLLNVVEGSAKPRRQRLKADRFVLRTNTTPRQWNFHGQMDSSSIRDDEAFDFVP